MSTFESGIFIIFVIIMFIYDARKKAAHRAMIKERANREFKIELTLMNWRVI
jgi:hypothetical protein